VSILVWSPLGGGWLSGKYTRHNRPESGRHVTGFKEPPIYDWDKMWDIVDVLVDVAGAHGVSGAQVALPWLLQRPAVASVIIGGRKIEQFEDNLKAVELKLAPEEIARLDDVSRPNLIYPHWHQNWAIRSRMTEDDHAFHDPYPIPN
jgi:aryl-alcohol dehydrogenase-like predicted oxidoreductase